MTALTSNPGLAQPPAPHPGALVGGLERGMRRQRESLGERVDASHRELVALRREVAALTALVVDQHRLMADLTETLRIRVDRVQRVIEGQASPLPPPDRHPSYAGSPREAVTKRGLGRGLDALFSRPEGEG